MTTEHVYEFLVLVSTMNFSRAAEKLFTTQSTLSRHIKELEDELGVKLLDRNSHTVTLTVKGQLFAQEAAHIHNGFLQVLHSADLTNTAAKTQIRIACANTAYSRTMQSFLRKLENSNQQYGIAVDILPDMELDHFAAEYDILFSPYEYHCPVGMTKAPYTLYEPAFLAINMRGASGKNPDSLSQINNQIFLTPYSNEMFCSYSYIRQYIDRLSGGKLHSHPVANVDSALLRVQMDQGITIVPGHFTKKSYQDVIFTAIDDPNCRFATFVYMQESLDYEFQQAFTEELETLIRNEAW